MDKPNNNNEIATTATATNLEISSNNNLESSSSKNNEKLRSRRIADDKAIINLKSRIPDIDNIFDIHGRIGNGTFSTVLLASLKCHANIPKEQRKMFAIKHLIPTSHPKRIQKELKCLVEIGGVDNIAGIDLCLRRNESVAFVMPYIAHDRFHDYFDKMDTIEIQKYLKNLLIALKRVHSFNIIHRDVKPSNFLYNRKSGNFMLVDFGLAQSVYNNDDIESNLLTTTATAIATNNNNNSEIKDQKSIINVDKIDMRKRKINDTTIDQFEFNDDNSTKRFKKESTTENHGVNKISKAPTSSSNLNSPFKMPLKQLNETITPKSNNLMNCTKLNSPLSRNVKSAILGVQMIPRLEEKFRIRSSFRHGNTGNINININININNNNNSSSSNNNITSRRHDNPSVTSTSKYQQNNNRGISSSYQQEQKCYCYGKNQVCNMCIVKKEIPASRAGTPGYRPPEVLLKYVEQTTSVDIWAVGVILISILSGVYPFFQAPDDFLALAEIVTIFGDDAIRRTAFILGRQVTMSRKCKPLDLRKLCIRLRNRSKLDRTEAVKKYQQQQQNAGGNSGGGNDDGKCPECMNCQQKMFDCLCANTSFQTEPIGDDNFPSSVYNLLERLLEVNPYKRITAEDALNHQFFKEIFS